MIFYYKAARAGGELVDGQLSAKSKQEVASHLKADNLTVLEVVPAEEWLAAHRSTLQGLRLRRGVSILEKVMLMRHLSVMIGSGLSIVDGLEILSSDSDNPTLKTILTEARSGIEAGQTLSQTLSRYPTIFDSSLIATVRAGEVTGKLAETLTNISERLEQEYEFIAKVRGALLYPAVILVALLGVGLIVVVLVVPKIATVFASLKVPTPLPTRVLLIISTGLTKAPLVSGAAAIILLAGGVLLARSRSGKRLFIATVNRLPYLKRLAQQVDLSRLNLSLYFLIKSGIPLQQALAIGAATVANESVKASIGEVAELVAQGSSLARGFKQQDRVFPVLMVRMIDIGERTGKLDRIFADLARFYRQEAERTLGTLGNLIEPILMVLVGVLIGGMVLSVIAPIYQVVSQVTNQ